MMEIKWNKEKIRKFEEENQEFLRNEAVISFLKIPTNKNVYMDTISNPTQENMNELDRLFKQFYFKMRFISHISSTLKFNSINYDKKWKLFQSRYILTLDASVNSNEGEGAFVDLIADEQSEYLFNEPVLNDTLEEHVTCPKLYNALNSLTKKQKEIIYLAYIERLNDTEIGKRLNKSQQAISKTHKKALENILAYLENKEIIDKKRVGG